jgi:uncharacterized protein (TIGR03437 family)
MRPSFSLFILSTVCFAQQPILYYRGTVNAASLTPFGLPNAPIARGSVFTVFGENLGPAQSPALAFPLSTALGGVGLTVTQSGVTTSAYPIFVSPGQINAIMPSTVKGGLATLRLTYNNNKSNAATIQISDAGPGIFAVSSGGYGPGIVQNYISADNQPINSSVTPASPGQVITIWGTGLGPVTFADNVAPTAGNVATAVSVTIGGQAAASAYAGRSPCCAGVDQIVATVPANAPLGCWVPVTINAGGWVSNTVTMAIAAPGASNCGDLGNPLSAIVRTPGAQAYIDFERMNTIDNVTVSPPNLKAMDKLYTRFYTRPDSPYNFDPYMSYPPAGSCLVNETSGNAFLNKSLRGALPAGASLNPQPTQAYNNGTQTLTISPGGAFFSSTVAATVNSTSVAMNPLGANASLTIDPSGPNETVVPMAVETPPSWTPPGGIITIPRNAPFTINFTPGDPAAPTAIVLYSYTAVYNATVSINCLAASGATSFTISPDLLSQIPPTYGRIDGSYVNLFIGTLGFNQAATFSNGVAASGIYLSSNWLGQAVVLQ